MPPYIRISLLRSPARAVRELTAGERERLLYSAHYYARLKELHRPARQ